MRPPQKLPPGFSGATQSGRRCSDAPDQRRLTCSDARALTPIQSIASYQLFSTHDTVGALNLYAENPDGFSQHDRDLGYIFAAHAAMSGQQSHVVNTSAALWPPATPSAKPKA
ncbi:hypothetical protein DFR67_1204 [Williamsia limnetica]|uniref:GAF domain-containing protein n=1 Tax=Williamsia limnetica TaxID=882452 RepID=A0A318RCZ7_WILLI|nr:GAF domain-containing protein [Williamsia limnetica]PYE12725.1 hypothetical protein DFR67_1204 [Williamsia limnetica]